MIMERAEIAKLDCKTRCLSNLFALINKKNTEKGAATFSNKRYGVENVSYVTEKRDIAAFSL